VGQTARQIGEVPNRFDRRREKTRLDLIQAAERVISSKGYHQTRIADIATEADVGLGTFYLHFKTKNEIFIELIEHGAAELRRELAEANQIKPVLPPRAEIYIDDAMMKGSQTIIGGTVQNISGEQLSDLSVEINFTKRKDGFTETKVIPLVPHDLAPGEQGRYSITITAQDYSAARVLGLKSGSLMAQIPFKTLPGAQRPLEKTPDGKTIMVSRPRPRGDEFINTPDNPARVP